MTRVSLAVLLLTFVCCLSLLSIRTRHVSAQDAASRPAGSITLVSPKPGTVSGNVRFEAKLDGPLPPATGLQFLLDGKPICGPIMQPPFMIDWHTANVWDGQTVLSAAIVDSAGQRLVQASEPVALRVNNGFEGMIKLDDVDLTKPLAGQVTLKIEASRKMTQAERDANKAAGQDPNKSTEALLVFVDGVQQTLTFGRSKIELPLDTRKLSDGPHELFIWAVAFRKDLPPFAMLRRQFVTSNTDHAPALWPRYARVYLTPGGSVDLAPTLRDGDRISVENPKVTYKVADEKVATIGKGNVLTAVTPGVTTVEMQSGDVKTKVFVVVNSNRVFAHFGRDGSILTEYEPKKSLWVRTMFGLGGNELEDPKLAAVVKSSGINVLSSGFYYNPADGQAKDFETWRKSWDAHWQRTEGWSKKHDMPLLLHGDDIARTPNELNGSVNLEWGPQAVRHAFQTAAASERVVGIEMIDEVSFLWGSTPVPTDGRWKKRTPPIQDDAFVRLMANINQVKGRPGVTWPIGGISGPDAAAGWMGDPRFSDYATLYWDVLAWRRAYTDGASFHQYAEALWRCIEGRMHVLQRERPMLMLASSCGPFYKKMGEGTEFVIGRDISHGPPSQPLTPHVGTLLMYAPASGMAGARIYNFDWKLWKDDRAKAKIGQGELQTGADPFEVGTDRWWSLAAAMRLIENLEPYMLMPQTHAPYLGEGIYTGAREGTFGEMVIAINMTNGARTIPGLPLPTANPPESLVYRFHGTTLKVERYSSGEVRKADPTLSLKPGEVVIRVAPPKEGKPQPVEGLTCRLEGLTCRFEWPLAEAFVSGEVGVNITASPLVFVPMTEPSDAAEARNKAYDASRRSMKVQLLVDGQPLKEIDDANAVGSFRCTWDSSKVKPGVWHSLTAIATDNQGNRSEARTAVYVVPPPTTQPATQPQ